MRSRTSSAGSDERGEEDVGPRAEPLLVRAHPAQPDECPRPPLPVRRLAHDLLEQRSRVPDLACLEVPLRRLDAAALAFVVVSRRRQPASLLQQVGGRIRRPARGGAPGGLVQRLRDCLVGLRRGQREMPRALLRVVEDLRELRVQRAALGSREQLVSDGREQRMRECEALPILLEDARRYRGGCLAASREDAVDDPHGRPGQRRGDLRGRASRRR